MDPADSFFQALDSEQLLKEHGRSLVADARELLRQDPEARVAGMITMPDSPDAPAIREFLAKMTGQAPPNGLMVGTVPRATVEPLLRARTGTEHWLEQGWQPQRVLRNCSGNGIWSARRGSPRSARCRNASTTRR